VIQASLDEAEHKITVIVADEQLSLAIGKGGQNARLAAKLTNWNIDLVSQSEVEAKKKAQGEADVPVEELEGLSPKMAQKLVSSGIETADEVKKAGIEGLTAVEGVGEKTAEKILASAVAALAALAATASAADAGSGNAVEDAGESEAGDVSVVETDDMVEDAEVAEETVAAAVETPAIQAGASGAVMNSVVTQSDEEMTRRPRDEDDDEHVWDIEREDTIVDDEDEDDEDEDDEDDEEEELDLGIDEGDDA
jgi:hypothetical protein